jgi:hypothetical protein
MEVFSGLNEFYGSQSVSGILMFVTVSGSRQMNRWTDTQFTNRVLKKELYFCGTLKGPFIKFPDLSWPPPDSFLTDAAIMK